MIKNTKSALFFVVALTIIYLLNIRQVVKINVWSVLYTHMLFNSEVYHNLTVGFPTGHARAALWLASDAMQSNNPVKAEAFIFPQADQGDPLAMRLLADAFIKQGNFSGALTIGQQARSFDYLLWVALQAQRAGHLEEALLSYESAWKLNSESGTLPLAIFLLSVNGNAEKAENVLRESMGRFPNSIFIAEWNYYLGEALYAQKLWNEAELAYQRTIVQSPDDWKTHISLGWTMYKRGDDLKVVLNEFDRAINCKNSQGNGHLAVAQVLAQEKRYEEADVWFVAALKLNPESALFYLARGDAAWQGGNLNLALEILQKTLERFPDYAPAYYEIANVYRLTKQPAKAIASLDQVQSIKMEWPNVFYIARAGNIYEWAGDTSKALQAYHQALLIDPLNSVALEGVARLSN